MTTANTVICVVRVDFLMEEFIMQWHHLHQIM